MTFSIRPLVLMTACCISIVSCPVAAQTAAPTPEAGPAPSPQPTDPAVANVAPAAAAQPTAPLSAYVLVPLPPPPPKPNHVPYEPGQRVPDGYHIEERTSRGLVIAGALTLGIPWAWGAGVANDRKFDDKSSNLLIPIAGPWIFLAAGGATGCSDDFCIASKSVLVLDGVAQAAGAIMLTAAFMYPRKELILNNELAVTFVPTALGRGGYGLGAVGTF